MVRISNDTESASKLNIVMANVNGINNTDKRDQILLHLEKYKPDILCLVDTRIAEDQYTRIRNDHMLGCFYSISMREAARGVCILIKKSLPIKVHSIEKDDQGNMIKMCCMYDNNKFNLLCIYGPNTDSPDFYENIFNLISNNAGPNSIIIGDYNLTMDPDLDNLNYVQARNTRARNKLRELMNIHGFVDVYRQLNDNKKDFTWTNNANKSQRGRLDMAVVSNTMLPFITQFKSVPKLKSDHKPLLLSIDFTNFKRGRGYWKFNNSLLNNPEYVNIVKKSLRKTCAIYHENEMYNNFYEEASEREIEIFNEQSPEQLQSLNFKISPDLLFEMLLNDIRNVTISFCSTLKLEREREGKALLKEVENLQKLESSGVQIENIELQLRAAQRNYENFIQQIQLQNTYLKDVKINKEGEKPTPYLCSLEKNRSAQKYISRLKVNRNDEEVLLTEQGEIESETRDFYLNLFNCRDEIDKVGKIEDFLGTDMHSFKTLTEPERQKFNHLLSQDLILRTLKKTKNDTAPGLTGFGYAFYKFFWRDLGTFFTNMTNYSFEVGILPGSLRRGVITLLPKGDKPTDRLKNLRPVTLLPAEYKLISGSVAEYINDVLPELINRQQVGFVRGRYIGECIRTTYDTFQWANNSGATGMLLLIDFEKAFDSVSFKYMEKMLSFFGFGENLMKWVKILLHNFSACINLAGNLTRLFDILRGARQGDPIASPLFVLSIEVLCIKIRNARSVMPFKINNTSVLMSLFADDMSIFLKYDENNLRAAVKILSDFHGISGLKIQLEKTQVVVFGRIPDGNYKLCPDIALTWEQSFKLLGINFDPTLQNMKNNYEEKIREIEKEINNWKHRFLTPLGRLVVVKTLLLSKLAHIAIVLPSIETRKIKQLEDSLYDFIWKGKHKVAREDAKKAIKDGGLAMPDISSSWQAFKLSWLKRLYFTKAAWGEIFMANVNAHFHHLSKEDVFAKIGTFDMLDIKRLINLDFWSEAFKITKNFVATYVKKNPNSIGYCYLWNCSLFMRDENPCRKNVFRSISEKIHYPVDILMKTNEGNRFLTIEEAREKFGNINAEQYLSLKVVIRYAFQKVKITVEEANLLQPFQPTLISIAMLSGKGCNVWSKIIKECTLSKKNILTKEQSWDRSLGQVQSREFWNNCYKNVQDLFFDNRLKLMYYHILRGSLETNRIVRKFIVENNGMCTFCNFRIETIVHLFWECDITKVFLTTSLPLLFQQFPGSTFNYTLKSFIFGPRFEKIYSLKSIISLYLKRYIWNTRCKKKRLDYEEFITWLKRDLRIKKACYREDARMAYLAELEV